MASDISEVDTDRHLDPGPSAWNFRDEVLRCLLHGKQSLPSGVTCSSHFPLLLLPRRSLADLSECIALYATVERQLVWEIAGYWHLVHMIWIDGTYDMAGSQELEKYRRESTVALGPVDTVKYAEAFVATGLMIRTHPMRSLRPSSRPSRSGAHADRRARRLPRQSRAL
jgi:hypothetical protein